MTIQKMNSEMEVMEVTPYEKSRILSDRERNKRRGDFWLTPEGRALIRDTWDDPEDGAIPLPLLNALEKLEEQLDHVGQLLAEEQVYHHETQTALEKVSTERDRLLTELRALEIALKERGFYHTSNAISAAIR